ncbi:hypothetical protein BJ138DRAFT_95561 [Hygrophoropsis aurantiaca]|uniref:Uncharacterized protein n=1 Tax=Hygrophoropsis aurantiaca TaxID=72124 RepID=A0ACB7ZRM5_9AGAM|nr:hypothetical protein BJ138DRAFT_95561 [Hygrophoropsis aurantiaca]
MPLYDRYAYLLPQSTSRSRASSLSSSILNLPARSQPPTSSRGLRNDFFDDTDSLPASARPQISAIPTIATGPIRLSMPRPTTVKTAPNNPLKSAPAPGNIFGHLGSRFRRDKPALEAIEMQPPPFKTRAKSSVVGKVALAEADVRLYVAKSKKKKQKPDDLADVKVGCWDIFRTLIGTCCLLRKDPDLDSDSESTSSRRK